MNTELKVNNISKAYLEEGVATQVLKAVNFSFFQGETYAIKGVSGSGKSTLLHILGGLDKPTSGEIWLGDINLHSLPDKKLSETLNSHLGFVFQFHYLINELTVLENVKLMGLINHQPDLEVEKRAKYLLEFLGLEDRMHFHPYKLSGGEQQRVSIARALFNRPKFLLADEPTGNLDKENATSVVKLLLKCKDEWNMGVIICTHDEFICVSMQHELLLSEGQLQPCKTK